MSCPRSPVIEEQPTVRKAERSLPYAEPTRLDRRALLRLLGLCAALPVTVEAVAASPKEDVHSHASIYDRMLGVRTIINAAGPVTALGGTVLSKEVTAAMAEAARSYVDLKELYSAAGTRLAEITKAPAAMVTAGACASMSLAAMACLAGDDQEKLAALPHPTWPRRETLLQRAHSTAYDRAYRNAGMTLVDRKSVV